MNENLINQVNQTWINHIDMVASQHWPKACLYVVASPIGNLADFSLRAFEALRRCDAVAAEDTRITKNLLNAWGINTSLLPAHRHNEHAVAEKILERLQAGQTIALVSDAGAPAVSDPGAYIVKQVLAVGIRVIPIPGASSVITALMASGATTDENPSFSFAGFIPSKPKARAEWLSDWLKLDHPVVMFETPHRILKASKAIADVADGKRLITVARELTKRFEQIQTLAIDQLCDWFEQDQKRQQGEFVLIVHKAQSNVKTNADISTDNQNIMRVLLAELSVKDAVRIGVKLTGVSRDKLYSWALKNN